MTYRLFLYILAQLATRRLAIITIGEQTLLFQVDDDGNGWKVSSKFSQVTQKNFTKQMKECFSTRMTANFLSKDSFLTVDSIDGPGVYLVRKVQPLKTYLSFKIIVEELLSDGDNFRDLFSLSKKNFEC